MLMTRIVAGLATSIGLLLCASVDVPSGKAIGDALDRARSEYRAKSRELAGLVVKEMDRADAAARKARNLKAVEKIKAERREFEINGTLPTVVGAKEYRRQIARARKVLKDAYTKAVGDYVAARLDTDAERTRLEMEMRQALWSSVSVLGNPSIVGTREAPDYRGNELALTDPTSPYCVVMLGTAELTDYDLKFQARFVGGAGYIAVRFHDTGASDFCAFDVGLEDRKRNRLVVDSKGNFGVLKDAINPAPLEYNRWYDVGLAVRGPEFHCFIDGVKCLEGVDARFHKGSIGIGTLKAAVHFRNFEVTLPDGKTLLRGLPKLPGMNPDMR